jgi:hypothetical protein
MNGGIFENKYKTLEQTWDQIKQEEKQWVLASAGHFSLPAA